MRAGIERAEANRRHAGFRQPVETAGSGEHADEGEGQDLRLPVLFRLDAECLRRNVRPFAAAAMTRISRRARMPQLHEIQEEVARRMARRLHDESAQLLALIHMDLADLAREAPAHTSLKVQAIVRKLDEIGEQLRGMSHECCPLVLEREGVLPAMMELADGIHRRSGLQVNCTGDLAVPLDAGRGIVLYRVVQEALSNVLRHAAASRVDIKLWTAGGRVYCTVRDDGIGFSLVQRARQRWCGLGLLGAHERVAAAGGSCRIVTHPGRGTEVQVDLPL